MTFNGGMSGGPLLIGDSVIGVLSGKETAMPGRDLGWAILATHLDDMELLPQPRTDFAALPALQLMKVGMKPSLLKVSSHFETVGALMAYKDLVQRDYYITEKLDRQIEELRKKAKEISSAKVKDRDVYDKLGLQVIASNILKSVNYCADEAMRDDSYMVRLLNNELASMSAEERAVLASRMKELYARWNELVEDARNRSKRHTEKALTTIAKVGIIVFELAQKLRPGAEVDWEESFKKLSEALVMLADGLEEAKKGFVVMADLYRVLTDFLEEIIRIKGYTWDN
jgi:hypothetical protein